MRGWQPPVDVASHPFPPQMMALAAALQGPPPEPADGLTKGDDTAPVVVHNHFLGGGFGRRLEVDFYAATGKRVRKLSLRAAR